MNESQIRVLEIYKIAYLVCRVHGLMIVHIRRGEGGARARSRKPTWIEGSHGWSQVTQQEGDKVGPGQAVLHKRSPSPSPLVCPRSQLIPIRRRRTQHGTRSRQLDLTAQPV